MPAVLLGGRFRRRGPAGGPAPTAPPLAGVVRRWRADMVTGLSAGAGVGSLTFSDGTVLTGAGDGQLPTYVPEAFGGQPAVHLDAAEQQNFYGTPAGSSAQPVTVVVILAINNAADGDVQVVDHGVEIGVFSGKWSLYAGATIGGTSTVTNGGAMLLEASFSGGSSRLAINGTQEASGGAGSLALSGELLLGRHRDQGRHMTGDLAEVIEYDHVLTASERTALATYVQARYGFFVAGATPATIPGSSTGTAPVNPVGKPAEPQTVTATAAAATGGATGAVLLSWQPPAGDGGSGVTAYQVTIAPVDAAGSAGFSDTPDSQQREYRFTALAPAAYRLSVSAVNAQGPGPAVTATVTVPGPTTSTPTPGDPLIVAPSQFVLTPSPGGIVVDWDDVPAPAGNFGRYEYRLGTTNPPAGPALSSDYASSATITGLDSTKGYYLQARSVTSAGAAGVWSAVQGPVTPQAPPAAPTPGTRLAHLQPFASNSVWNLPVADTAEYESVTGPLTDRMRNVWGPYAPGINWDRYSHPVNLASASDPVAAWNDTKHGADSGYGPPGGVFTFRTPRGVFIATGSDQHCHVVDPERRYVYETFYANRQSDTAYTCERHHKVDLYGSGTGPQSGTRAYGGSAIGGLIRVHEIDQASQHFQPSGLTVGGRAVPLIPHALAIALINEQLKDHTPTNSDFSYNADGSSKNTSGYVWPATETDGDGPWNYTGTIPMGAYFVLDRAVSVTGMGLSWAGTALALAAQTYGIYTTDRSGQTVFYLEISANPPAAVKQFLDAAWNDVPKILKQCRAVTNNRPSTPNGGPLGSSRRAPLAANLT